MNIRWRKLWGNSEPLLSHLYERYVQLLYNYGMHVCHDHAFVKNALGELFGHVQHEGELCVTYSTIRFCLFKRLRDLVIRRRIASGNSYEVFRITDENSSAHSMPAMSSQLSPHQREAIFLKLNCGFSYHEIAAIMGVKTESACNLVSQAIEIVRENLKEFNGSSPVGIA